MIQILWHLFRLDIFRTFQWFQQNRLAKLVVALVSLLFFSGIGYMYEQTAYYYFFSLHQFEPYGFLTTEYLLHAALLVSLWFTAISSFVLATNQVWTEDTEWNWLLTQPTSSFIITLWHHWRTLLPNTALLTVLWLPPSIGFVRVYQTLSWNLFLPVMLLLILLLTAGVQIFTTSLAWLLAPRMRRFKQLILWSGGIMVVIASYWLFTSILPTSLQSLLRIDIDQFADAFSALPLNQPWFVTREFLSPLTGFSLTRFATLTGSLLVTSIALLSWQAKTLRKTFALAKSSDSSTTLQSNTTAWYRWPLIWKEWTSFTRTQSEMNFFLFFTGLIVFFFFFLHRALTLNLELQSQLSTLLPFSLGTILFLTTAFLLRLVFPLLAREGESAWHTLTEPVHRINLLVSKFTFSLLLGLFVIMAINIGWWLLPLSATDHLSMAIYSTVGIFLITGYNALLGFWEPNWQAGRHPDQMSTSIQGFVALGISLLLTAFSIWGWITDRSVSWLWLLGGGTLGLILLFLITYRFALRHYRVTQ